MNSKATQTKNIMKKLGWRRLMPQTTPDTLSTHGRRAIDDVNMKKYLAQNVLTKRAEDIAA